MELSGGVWDNKNINCKKKVLQHTTKARQQAKGNLQFSSRPKNSFSFFFFDAHDDTWSGESWQLRVNNFAPSQLEPGRRVRLKKLPIYLTLPLEDFEAVNLYYAISNRY